MESTFPASLDHLHQMLQFVSGNAVNAGFMADEVLQIELALEEAVVNIIEHGSSKDIQIQCNSTVTSLQVKLIDAGRPFNPMQDVMSKVGGYGIPLMTKIMDSIDYEYKDGKNILILSKGARQPKHN